MKPDEYLAPAKKAIRLKDFATDGGEGKLSKDQAEKELAEEIELLTAMQSKLYAQDRWALLVVLQGIDASGKDGTIKRVMSGINPSGCQVTSFKVPSNEELDHDYLWRYAKAAPERGRIGIFNRSYYEEVLVVRVHPELLARQKAELPKKLENLWERRFREINNYEQYLVDNGVIVLKFFLHVSKDEQKKRFMTRLNSADKNWKFSMGDVKERGYWNQYVEAFEDMLTHTSTEQAPWYIVPADRKWFTHLVVARAIVQRLSALKLEYPKLNKQQLDELEEAKKLLDNEK